VVLLFIACIASK